MKERRIAVIGAPEEPRFSEVVAGLKNGLGELGYAKPSLVVQEVKIARSEEKGAKSIVEGLLRQQAQVLFLIGSRLLKPVREASAEVPVVFLTPGDPVAAGLVQSLARPGGNTTAMTFEFPELSGKRLELIKELAPKVRRVLAIYDPRDPSPRQGIMAARQAAPSLGLTLIEREAHGREELLRGLEVMAEADAYLSVPGGFATGFYEEITRMTNAKRIPAIFHARMGSTQTRSPATAPATHRSPTKPHAWSTRSSKEQKLACFLSSVPRSSAKSNFVGHSAFGPLRGAFILQSCGLVDDLERRWRRSWRGHLPCCPFAHDNLPGFASRWSTG